MRRDRANTRETVKNLAECQQQRAVTDMQHLDGTCTVVLLLTTLESILQHY